MLVHGQISNGSIIPDEPLKIAEGVRVTVEVQTEAGSASLKTQPRQGGWWKGKVQISDDFDSLPADIAKAFGMEPL